MRLIEKFRYRPEIDGLRAIAVGAVVLYHARLGCPGGFIGVDVFFVISGYLITSLIWKDLEAGTFSFAGFWERRARRILPALSAVTLVVMIAGWFLLLVPNYLDLGRATEFQTAFVANLHYLHTSGYFAATTQEKPLLHVWSLAVEEQFYFLIPFLLWGVFQVERLRSRVFLLGMVSVLAVVAFITSVVVTAYAPTSAFYLLPCRAWELLLGSWLAFLPVAPRESKLSWLREVLSFAGLAFICHSALKTNNGMPFPGLGALPPCLGATLFIGANDSKPTAVGRLLSTAPFTFLGAISYSLYLWHWPFLAFARNISLFPLLSPVRIGLVVAGLACALFSWKWVETPFRQRKWGATRRSMFGFAACSLLVPGLGGILIARSQGFPNRYPAGTQRFAAATSDIAFRIELSADQVRRGEVVPLGTQNAHRHPALMVWGDSHAMAVMPAIDQALREEDLSGVAATRSRSAPVLGWSSITEAIPAGDAIAFNDAAFAYIRDHHIQNVMLAGHWRNCIDVEAKRPQKLFSVSLLATVRKLRALGVTTSLMLDVPLQDFNVPKALARPIYSRAYIDSICARPKLRDDLQDQDVNLLQKMKAAGVHVIDPKPYFLDPSRKRYIVEKDGYSLYWDDRHLTVHGAKLLVPFFRRELRVE